MWAAILAAALMVSDVPHRPTMRADLAPVVDAYADTWNVSVPIYSMPCGQVNAWYNTVDNYIVLCDETLALEPAVVRFILAHELAHATMHKAGFDLGEAGADELATLMELETERDDVRAMAEFLMSDGIPDATPGDVHPPNMKRAAMLLCLDDGYEREPTDEGCNQYERRAVQWWATLLSATLSTDKANEDP